MRSHYGSQNVHRQGYKKHQSDAVEKEPYNTRRIKWHFSTWQAISYHEDYKL